MGTTEVDIERVKKLSIAALPIQEQRQILADRFADWKGDLEQVDDVCVLGIRI